VSRVVVAFSCERAGDLASLIVIETSEQRVEVPVTAQVLAEASFDAAIAAGRRGVSPFNGSRAASRAASGSGSLNGSLTASRGSRGSRSASPDADRFETMAV